MFFFSIWRFAKKFYELQDHLNERINTPMYNVLKSNLMTFFKTILSLEDFDEATIMKTTAILDTNAFEVRSPDGRSRFRAIYAEAAMFSHDCVPNCYHSFDENMQIAIRAASKYELIVKSYHLWHSCSTRFNCIWLLNKNASKTLTHYIFSWHKERGRDFTVILSTVAEHHSTPYLLAIQQMLQLYVPALSRSDRMWNIHWFVSLSKM